MIYIYTDKSLLSGNIISDPEQEFASFDFQQVYNDKTFPHASNKKAEYITILNKLENCDRIEEDIIYKEDLSYSVKEIALIAKISLLSIRKVYDAIDISGLQDTILQQLIKIGRSHYISVFINHSIKTPLQGCACVNDKWVIDKEINERIQRGTRVTNNKGGFGSTETN